MCGVVLHAHPVRGESHNQRNTTGEVATRAGSEILAIWAALKQRSENTNKAMCLVLLRLIKTKNFKMLLSFFQHWHLT